MQAVPVVRQADNPEHIYYSLQAVASGSSSRDIFTEASEVQTDALLLRAELREQPNP